MCLSVYVCSDGSPNFKKHGLRAPAWVCFTVHTEKRTYDFSASSSSLARAAVMAITHASNDRSPLQPGMVGSLIWMAARWHLVERWREQGGVKEKKLVLADLLWQYASEAVRFTSLLVQLPSLISAICLSN